MRCTSVVFAVTIIAGCLATSGATMPDVNTLPMRKEMPGPLVMNDGAKVTTARQWDARRTGIKRILEYYCIGTIALKMLILSRRLSPCQNAGIETVIRFLEELGHRDAQLGKAERFIQDAIDRVGTTRLLWMPGDHEDRLLRRQFPDLDGKFVAFNKWHAPIGQNQVKLILSEETQSLGAVVGFHDLVLVLRKKTTEGLSDRPFVVHQ